MRIILGRVLDVSQYSTLLNCDQTILKTHKSSFCICLQPKFLFQVPPYVLHTNIVWTKYGKSTDLLPGQPVKPALVEQPFEFTRNLVQCLINRLAIIDRSAFNTKAFQQLSAIGIA